MNFFDTWEVARAPTPQPPTADQQGAAQEQPTLNEEVNEVIGQLGRFWGGFRTQSQKVLETAKKDFGDVVVQAQKEIEKFSAPVSAPAPSEGETSAKGAQGDTSTSEQMNEGNEDGTQQQARSATTGDYTDPTTPSASTSPGSIFSRLQSAIPPTLIATVQSHIPDSVKHASENVDLAQIRTNLLSEFQRVQGVTRAQAEEYAHKGEAYLREVIKEANEVLQDAVQIIPPSPTQGGDSGLVWDGTDMWMLPTGEASSRTEEGAPVASRQGETQTAVASRALVLLTRLQSDPTIIKHDPEAEESVKEKYQQWITEAVESKGGIDGEEWSQKGEVLLKENTTLYEMYTSLVPAELSKEAFWSRYFFRAHQITLEEERRKALIQATTETDEDFSWEGSEEDDDDEEEEEDDDDDDDSSTSSEVEAEKTQTGKSLASSTSTSRPVAPGSRVSSSEDSYDVVSSTNASVAGDSKPPPTKQTDDSSDSDWE